MVKRSGGRSSKAELGGAKTVKVPGPDNVSVRPAISIASTKNRNRAKSKYHHCQSRKAYIMINHLNTKVKDNNLPRVVKSSDPAAMS